MAPGLQPALCLSLSSLSGLLLQYFEGDCYFCFVFSIYMCSCMHASAPSQPCWFSPPQQSHFLMWSLGKITCPPLFKAIQKRIYTFPDLWRVHSVELWNKNPYKQYQKCKWRKSKIFKILLNFEALLVFGMRDRKSAHTDTFTALFYSSKICIFLPKSVVYGGQKYVINKQINKLTVNQLSQILAWTEGKIAPMAPEILQIQSPF